MSCEQKSGVFLNISCKNKIEETCSNCQKKVCNVHVHVINAKKLCEDCYWENYLYTADDTFTRHHEVDVFIATSNSNTSHSSNSASTPTGFDDGFGGGGFGGGGASSSWTEGDIQSLNDTGTENGGLLSTDDTFFYS